MIAALTALLMRKETDTAAPERTDEERGSLPAEIVFRKWKNAMFRAAFEILGDDGQAEDAVMDALEKICADPERFRISPGTDDSRLKLLVMRTVENAALDRYRKRKRRLRRESPLPSGEEEREDGPASENGESAEEAFFAGEELLRCDFGALEQAVRTLPEKYRTLLVLRYGEEYGNREIAAMLGIPESTVATRLARAREALKRKIGEGR